MAPGRHHEAVVLVVADDALRVLPRELERVGEVVAVQVFAVAVLAGVVQALQEAAAVLAARADVVVIRPPR